MTDTAPNPDDVIPDAMARAVADLGDGRAALMVQLTPADPVRWFVPDARYSDGWRELTDRDEIGALVADINAHQATQAEAVTSGPGPDPVLVKGDDGASHIGTGLAPEDSTGGGADDPEASTAGGEATPTAGTTTDDEADDDA
jgi:hypothetical protein